MLWGVLVIPIITPGEQKLQHQNFCLKNVWEKIAFLKSKMIHALRARRPQINQN